MGEQSLFKMEDVTNAPLAEQEEKSRSIPAQEFIEDVRAHTKNFDNVQDALVGQETMLSKYRFMEQQMLAQRQALLAKRPDLNRSVSMVTKLLEAREAGEEVVKTTFQLGTSVFADAEIPVSDELEVGLWLGANVMVQFPLDEASQLVRDNLSQCEVIITTLDKDVDFVKDQIVTSEVNMARIYNNDVRERQAAKAAGIHA